MPTEPCEELPVPLELPSMGVGFLVELVPVAPLPRLLSTETPWVLAPPLVPGRLSTEMLCVLVPLAELLP